MGGEVALAVALEPLPMRRAIRAVADVVEVDEDAGFCASVYLAPGGIAVARLARSLDGAPHEGAVLRRVMVCTTGCHGPGLFVYRLGDDGGVRLMGR